MNRYTVAIAGLGNRGKTHVKGFSENPDRFEIVGIYDPNPNAVEETINLYGDYLSFGSANEMLQVTKPDVFCFVTHPEIRMEYVQLGIENGIKALAFEKPMALSLKEAKAIRDICKQAGIKAIVSHQQKYILSMQKLKHILERGVIGHPYMIHISMAAWAPQLATHFIDYALWANNGISAESVVGHVHGRDKLTDGHPYADYLMAQAIMKNDVRLIIESGYYSPQHTSRVDEFWLDNRITVYGDTGYVWAQTNGAWSCFTPESPYMQKGSTENWREQELKIQTPYCAQLADWLDDDTKIHPCNIDISYTGFEILEAAGLSALDNRRIDLPIIDFDYIDVLERMKNEIK